LVSLLQRLVQKSQHANWDRKRPNRCWQDSEGMLHLRLTYSHYDDDQPAAEQHSGDKLARALSDAGIRFQRQDSQIHWSRRIRAQKQRAWNVTHRRCELIVDPGYEDFPQRLKQARDFLDARQADSNRVQARLAAMPSATEGGFLGN
jgi:hypothetical protein